MAQANAADWLDYNFPGALALVLMAALFFVALAWLCFLVFAYMRHGKLVDLIHQQCRQNDKLSQTLFHQISRATQQANQWSERSDALLQAIEKNSRPKVRTAKSRKPRAGSEGSSPVSSPEAEDAVEENTQNAKPGKTKKPVHQVFVNVRTVRGGNGGGVQSSNETRSNTPT